MNIKIELLEGGKLPTRAYYNDAGADVFSRINYTLKPNETKAIPLGIKIFLPKIKRRKWSRNSTKKPNIQTCFFPA